jgi:hypothetical protein
MSPDPSSSGNAPGFQIQEIRYSLADMITEVAAERQTGAFGMERLPQSEIKKVLLAKTRKPRAPKT